MHYDQELRRLHTIFNDEEAYRELLNQRGTLAQSLLDLLQLLIDAPDITTTLRTSICTTMLRLSKASDLYPSCMTIQNLNTIGNHPVAGGGFGDIWKGVLGGDSGQVVCLKVVKMYIMSDVKRLLKDFLREAIVWRQLIHPNVLPCLGLYYLDNNQERMCLVSPWMENGNLAHYLQNTPRDSINQLQLMHDVTNGISYLHTLQIVHGDLKGLNILITPAHRACIADFGLSRVADSQLFKITSSSSHAAGTARWSAPEIHMGSTATKESDIYSYGCVCYEIVTGLRPFHHLPNEAAVAFAVWRGDRPPKPMNVEIQDELWLLIKRCWEGEPGSRPNIADVLHSLVDLNPSGATIPLAEGWDSTLFTELRNNVERSDHQPQVLTDFLTALEVKCKHIPERGLDMGALVESLPEDHTVAIAPEDEHTPGGESKLEKDIRKLKKLCRKLMDLADGRLAFRHFAKGDLALFLQTRKPKGNWATFNVTSPHHFLQAPENVKEQLKAREWFVARITSITERVVVHDDPTSTNPYGLDDGTNYFLLQADLDWSKPSPELLRSREALTTGNWTRQELVKQGKMYREQARQKIEFNKFLEGDLALFLPTRNTITGTWAPFKISFFHIYLSPTGELAGQTKTREWILGRITSITERVVDPKDPTSNPFGLIGNGLKYWTVDAKEWTKTGDHSQSKSRKQKPVRDIPSPASEEDDIVIVNLADYGITEAT